MKSLQFITHYTDHYSYYNSALLALKGGCRWIQLRMKEASPKEIESVALLVQKACKEYNAVFIIDDQVELVKKIKADGVHVGKSDMPVAQARKLLGKEFIIGGTANCFEDSKEHYQAGADYIGLGPFRYTTTKKNLNTLLGIEGYQRIISQMKAEHISIPVVAIGGITVKDIPELMQTGISGIALSGTILNADDPVRETERIIEELNRVDS